MYLICDTKATKIILDRSPFEVQISHSSVSFLFFPPAFWWQSYLGYSELEEIFFVVCWEDSVDVVTVIMCNFVNKWKKISLLLGYMIFSTVQSEPKFVISLRYKKKLVHIKQYSRKETTICQLFFTLLVHISCQHGIFIYFWKN